MVQVLLYTHTHTMIEYINHVINAYVYYVLIAVIITSLCLQNMCVVLSAVAVCLTIYYSDVVDATLGGCKYFR